MEYHYIQWSSDYPTRILGCRAVAAPLEVVPFQECVPFICCCFGGSIEQMLCTRGATQTQEHAKKKPQQQQQTCSFAFLYAPNKSKSKNFSACEEV